MATILSISIPPELRTALDAEAARQRRSRSFIATEAFRGYLAAQERDAFTAGRDRTLREGLALSPVERVRLAEALWGELVREQRPAPPWTATFETFEEYERWRRQRGRRPA